MPKVSIVIPVYNAEAFLPMCLSSIVNQTLTDWEVIAVNDGSTDGSWAILQAYAEQDKRFHLLSVEHGGQALARNEGLKHIQGEYCTFVDADDYIDSDYLEQLVTHIGSCDLCQCGYRRVSAEGEIIEEKRPSHFYQFTSPCMRLYRTDFMKQHNLHFEKMIYEDVVFSVDIWKTQPTYLILPYSGYNYVYNPKSTTSQRHKKEEHYLFSLLRQRARQASFRTRCLIAYTALRLRIHYLLGH